MVIRNCPLEEIVEIKISKIQHCVYSGKTLKQTSKCKQMILNKIKMLTLEKFGLEKNHENQDRNAEKIIYQNPALFSLHNFSNTLNYQKSPTNSSKGHQAINSVKKARQALLP